MENYIKKKDLDSGNLENLSEEKRNEIVDIKNKMDVSYQGTLDFGNDASKKLSDFSTTLLETVKLKDMPMVDNLLSDLIGNINRVDANTLLSQKPSLFKRIFHVDDIKQFITKYDDVSSVIVDIKGNLQEAQIQLKKDIELCSKYIEQDIEYINDLDKYIMAGTIKIDELKSQIEEMQNTIDPEDTLAIQDVNMRQGALERLERKVYNLRLMREVAIQNIPQMNFIQKGDCVLVEKIQTSVDTAIPLWESQIVVAIALARQQGGIEIEKAITDTTNQLLTANSELLKNSAIQIAKDLETGVVDIEVIKKCTQNLVDTLEGAKKVQMEGIKERERATLEMEANHKKLIEAMTLSTDQEKLKIEG